MTITNPIGHEIELVERLCSQGYAAFRTASSGPNAVGECDVIAIKDGDVYIFNLVILETGSSTKNVIDKSDGLKKLKRRSDTSSLVDEFEATVGHAVHDLTYDNWLFAGMDEHKIRATANYKTLAEVMGE